MIHRTHSLLPGAALLAVLAWPAALSAQDSQSGAGAVTPTRTMSTTAVRAAPQDEGAVQDEDAADAAKGQQRREILSKLRSEEVRHRERLATINRLRELAEQQGQAEKLALLDKLEVKEGARYNAATQYTAVQLGNTTAYKQTLIKLAAGRIRHDGEVEHAAKPTPPKLTPEERQARKEAREAKKAAEAAAAPKSQTASKPTTNRKKKVEMVTPPGKNPTGPKVKHKKDAGSTAPGGDPAKPGEPAPAPAPSEQPPPAPAPGEQPPPADGGTPRSGS